MKRPFTFLFLFLSVGVFGQDWKMIRPEWHYHYKLGESAASITHTIITDSIQENGIDTVYFLNRVISPCDTCTDLIAGYCYAGGCIYTRNGAQFLLRTMRLQPDGVVLMQDPSEYVMKPAALVGNSWMFSSSLNIEATVDSVSEMNVLGEIDSVKFISLSNGREIHLSRNHGVVMFPDFGSAENYLLSGIGGALLGERLPSAAEVFNFQPGDEFMYAIDGSAAMVGCWNHLVKHRIISKTSYPDSVTYSLQKVAHYMYWNCMAPWSPGEVPPDSYSNQFTSVTYRYEDFPDLLNAAPSAPVVFEDDWTIPNSIYKRCSAYLYDERYVVEYGSSQYLNHYDSEGFGCQFYVTPDNNPESDFLLYGDVIGGTYCGAVYNAYMESMGIVCRVATDNFENMETTHLIGALVQGDTIGTIYSDGVILKHEENTREIFSIYPNPANDELRIQSGEEMISYRILGVDGSAIRQENIYRHTSSIDTHDLGAGVYYLVMETAKGTTRKKFMIMR